MTSPRKMVPVHELEDGMELHADVLDNLERVLARGGTMLTETHRRIFLMCGVEVVAIVRSETAPAPSAEEIAERMAAEKELRVRFRKTDLAAEPMQRLFEETVERTLRTARWNSGAVNA